MVVVAETIQGVFTLNRFIVLSVSGQAFFVLGLAITSRLLDESHLPLARSLKWLAAFGFLLAFHEWGDVFVPVQSQFLAEPIVGMLLMAQVVILSVSFACLFQFGVETLGLAPAQRRFAIAPAAALALWLAWAFGPVMSWSGGVQDWHRTTEIAARYLLCLPAALLAAWGLRRQAQNLIAPLQLPHIWRTLRVAGLALAAYAVVGGLVVPAGGFFPANVLNEEAVFQATNVPVAVYRGAVGLVLAWAMVRSLRVFREESDRQIAAIQEESALASERERFARELHDGTLQTVYAAGLLLRSAERGLGSEADPHALAAVERSIGLLDTAVEDLRSTLGQLRPANAGRGLGGELERLVAESYLRALVDVDLELALDPAWEVAPGREAHVVAIAREALSNVVRHAQARRVVVRAATADNRLRLTIEDDGRGQTASAGGGSGLRNMRDRARLLGGDLDIRRTAKGGTIVELDVPCSEGHELAGLA